MLTFVVPLICFIIVGFYQTNRVVEQFDLCQSIRNDPFNLDRLYKKDKTEIDINHNIMIK